MSDAPIYMDHHATTPVDERVVQGVFVQNGASSRIDQQRAGFHLPEFTFAQYFFSGLIERQCQHDERRILAQPRRVTQEWCQRPQPPVDGEGREHRQDDQHGYDS